MSFFSSIAKIGKSIIQSPVTKAAAGGLAVVFPPAGVPAVAAVATANAALAAAESPQGKALLSAADKAMTGKRKVQLRAAVKKQLAAGVPRATVKLKAKAAVTSLAQAQAAKHKAALARQLVRTAQLAKAGDAGAKRALATFRVVAAARKGDPKARQAVALIAHRWEVGQRVRSRFELTHTGRIRARV